jgi:hypothetical protein
MTKTIVSKLITYFVAGLSDEDACELAGISRSTLNRYIKKYPAFWHKKNSAKNKITNQARLNIANDIDSWWLDSSWKRVKAKDPEFKSRSLFGWDEWLEWIKINEINIKISKK